MLLRKHSAISVLHREKKAHEVEEQEKQRISNSSCERLGWTAQTAQLPGDERTLEATTQDAAAPHSVMVCTTHPQVTKSSLNFFGIIQEKCLADQLPPPHHLRGQREVSKGSTTRGSSKTAKRTALKSCSHFCASEPKKKAQRATLTCATETARPLKDTSSEKSTFFLRGITSSLHLQLSCWIP